MPLGHTNCTEPAESELQRPPWLQRCRPSMRRAAYFFSEQTLLTRCCPVSCSTSALPPQGVHLRQRALHRISCSQCHCSISLAPSTLWLAIPAATDPVFLLAFLFQPPLETFLLLLFLGKNILTFLVCIVLFSSFSTAFHDAHFSP